MADERDEILRRIRTIPGVELVNGRKHRKVYYQDRLVLVLSHGRATSQDRAAVAYMKRQLRAGGVPL